MTMKCTILPMFEINVDDDTSTLCRYMYQNMIHDAMTRSQARRDVIHAHIGETDPQKRSRKKEEEQEKNEKQEDDIPRISPEKVQFKNKLREMLRAVWKIFNYTADNDTSLINDFEAINLSDIIGNRSEFTSENDFNAFVELLHSLQKKSDLRKLCQILHNSSDDTRNDSTDTMIGVQIGSLTGQVTSVRQIQVLTALLNIPKSLSKVKKNDFFQNNLQGFERTMHILRSGLFFIKDLTTICDSAENTQILNEFRYRTLALYGNQIYKENDMIMHDWFKKNLMTNMTDTKPILFLPDEYTTACAEEDTTKEDAENSEYIAQVYRINTSNASPFLQWTYKIRLSKEENRYTQQHFTKKDRPENLQNFFDSEPNVNVKYKDHDFDIRVDDIFLAGKLVWSSRSRNVFPTHEYVTQKKHIVSHISRGICAKKHWNKYYLEYGKIESYHRLPAGDDNENLNIRLFIILLIKSLGDIGICVSSRHYQDTFGHLGAHFFVWTNDEAIWPFYNSICNGKLLCSSHNKYDHGILLPKKFFNKSLFLSILDSTSIKLSEHDAEKVSAMPNYHNFVIDIVKRYQLLIQKQISVSQLQVFLYASMESMLKYDTFVPNSRFLNNSNGWATCPDKNDCEYLPEKFKWNKFEKLQNINTRFLKTAT